MVSFLYYEDDLLSRKVMQVLLTKKLGYTNVTIFENSADYLAKAQALSYTPDIILLDIHMQPHSGFEVLAGLRAVETFKTCKIVALTASVMSEEVDRLRIAGFDSVIGKPIDGNTFPDLLMRILKGENIWRPT